jgi:hypothetical protein
LKVQKSDRVVEIENMVLLHVKSRETSLFLLETKLDCTVDDVLKAIADVQNGRLKVLRICTEVEELVRSLFEASNEESKKSSATKS